MKEKRKKGRMRLGMAGTVLGFIAVLLVCVNGILFFAGRASNEGAETLRSGIRRASVQCYAIEGRYPPSIEYLEENYGIQIDRERYHVFYSGFASNIMPEIIVNPAETET